MFTCSSLIFTSSSSSMCLCSSTIKHHSEGFSELSRCCFLFLFFFFSASEQSEVLRQYVCPLSSASLDHNRSRPLSASAQVFLRGFSTLHMARRFVPPCCTSGGTHNLGSSSNAYVNFTLPTSSCQHFAFLYLCLLRSSKSRPVMAEAKVN